MAGPLPEGDDEGEGREMMKVRGGDDEVEGRGTMKGLGGDDEGKGMGMNVRRGELLLLPGMKIGK